MFKPKWEFDFKVTIDKHIVTMVPGGRIVVTVKLELIRGKPQPVDLEVNTNWQSVGFTTMMPANQLAPWQTWKTNLFIESSKTTPPGEYLFTVRGSTKGTFSTSEDAVTVIIKPDTEDKKAQQNNVQPAPEIKTSSGSPSLDLDQLFVPNAQGHSAGGGVSANGNEEIEQLRQHSSFGAVMGAIIIIIIFLAILAAAGVFKPNGEGGSCPASAPIDCGDGCCPAGDGGRTDVCCPGNKCTKNGKCTSTTPVNPGGCPPLDCSERGLGGAVPKQCPCPPGCPYESVTNLQGFKQCSSFR